MVMLTNSLTLRRLRQKGHEFQASLGYVVRPWQKKKKSRVEFSSWILDPPRPNFS
jgi:hypothetical protein